MSQRNLLKKIIGKLHLYLGFVSGLVVFVVSLTGCIYAFQHEIQDLMYPYRFVENIGEKILPPSELIQLAEAQFEDKKALRLYLNPGNRSSMVLFYSQGFYHNVYIDPYSGEILKDQNMMSEFFTIVLQLHRTLLLPGKAGKLTVPVSTLIFVVMLITGIILWWPRNKAGQRQRFTIKWDGGWRRKNYDLHNVVGFYASIILLLIALTGLVWGFQWFERSIYWATSGGKQLPSYPNAIIDVTDPKGLEQTLDRIVHKIKTAASPDQCIMVFLPRTETSPILVATNEGIDQFHTLSHRMFNPYTGEELPVATRYGPYQEATAADKILKLNYDLHTGGILGFFGKLLAFLASLVSATLPVTGFMIWWGRRRKNDRRKAEPILKKDVKRVRPKLPATKISEVA